MNLTTSNPACTGASLTCSIAVPAATGTGVFTVSAYDAQQTSNAPATPAGNLLSTTNTTGTAYTPHVAVAIYGVNMI